MVEYTSLNLSRKNVLVFILIFTTIAVLDTSIVWFSAYGVIQLSTTLNVAIFVIFSGIFIAINVVLLNSVRKIMSNPVYRPAASIPKYLHSLIILIFILTVAVIITIILQMILQDSYNIILLRIQTYLSHLSPLIFLSFLIFLFATWITSSKRNYIIMLFVISFSLVSINLVISLLYLESYFNASAVIDIRSYPIISYLSNIGGQPRFAVDLFISAFDALSLASFLLMWITTLILLSQFRHRLGGKKYFVLMSLPLIYFIFPFQNYFGDVLLPFLLSSPIIFSVLYVLFFSATTQVGAFLFSLSFWSASSLVHDDRVSRSLLISCTGVAFLFGSIELAPLQYYVFPPYGLITEAFTPLGAYLVFVGIFISAKHISQDANLRKGFYKTAESQLGLLKTIGVSEMEREIEKKARDMEQLFKKSGTWKDFDLKEVSQLEDQNVKEILREVLNELYYSKKDKEQPKK
jgi:hypothetical protein